MTPRTLTRVVYAMLGVLYLLGGAGSIAIPAGWLSPRWAGADVADFYMAATPESFLNHLTQEFGSLAIGIGLVFLWQARRDGPSRSLHWLLTAYLVLDSSIHWVGPQGFIGSLQRGLINSIPPVLLLIIALIMWWRTPKSADMKTYRLQPDRLIDEVTRDPREAKKWRKIHRAGHRGPCDDRSTGTLYTGAVWWM